ncbi:MAG: TIGR03089 family protein [Actinocrinis sp.]
MTISSFGGGPRAGSAPRDVASVWRARLGADAARPFLTFLDETTGERVELSATTFGNWLAKTGNLIQDDLTAGPGDRVAVSAPPHWLTAVWLVAPLLTSAVVDPWGEPKSAHTVISGPDERTLADARECAGERLALSLLPLGMPFAQVPQGFRDYSAEVRGFGDRFGSFTAPGPDTPALAVDGSVLTHAELVERATVAAVGLAGADRVLLDARRDAFSGAEAIEWLFAPMVAGAGVVVVRGATPERLSRIAETERTTRRLTLD